MANPYEPPQVEPSELKVSEPIEPGELSPVTRQLLGCFFFGGLAFFAVLSGLNALFWIWRFF